MIKSTMRARGRVRAFSATLALALLLSVAFVATASALPSRFWGVVPQTLPSGEQFQLLKKGGADSIRVPFVWSAVQPIRGGLPDWSATDVIVERAAQVDVEVLPFVSGAPQWAVPVASVPGDPKAKAPAHLPATGAAAVAWSNFLKLAVARYGPAGTFWDENPNLPRHPIRTWQIWNEENFKYFVARPNPAEYGKLVKISYAAIKAADPGGRIVLGGMFARPKGSRFPGTDRHRGPSWYASDFLREMYKRTPGIKTRFNGVALHPYTRSYRELPDEIEEFRNVLTDSRDAGKGLWITELGWSSQPPAPSTNIFAKGIAGQARELKGAFTLLRNRQVAWKVQRLYWFSVDDTTGTCNFCDGSGLFGEGFEPKRSWFEFVRFAGGTA